MFRAQQPSPKSYDDKPNSHHFVKSFEHTVPLLPCNFCVMRGILGSSLAFKVCRILCYELKLSHLCFASSSCQRQAINNCSIIWYSEYMYRPEKNLSYEEPHKEIWRRGRYSGPSEHSTSCWTRAEIESFISTVLTSIYQKCFYNITERRQGKVQQWTLK